MKQFKITIAGCGTMSNAWVEYALSRDDSEIIAFVDLHKEKAHELAQRYSLDCGIYTDISEAIESSVSNLVFDVTTPDSHKDIVMAALDRDCDVMGEKPIAVSMEEAQQVISAVEQSGRMYAVMQNCRYNSNVRAFKELISSGIIGQHGFICVDYFMGSHFGGYREIMKNPLMLDLAIHTFDQARFILGVEPTSVYCHEFNPVGSWYQGNAAAICIFEFSDGSVFCYRGSCCAEGCSTELFNGFWRVMGSKGTAIWDGINIPYCEVVIPSDKPKIFSAYKKIEATSTWQGREDFFGHFGCLDEMFSALIEDRPAETDCRDNLKSMAMVFSAMESAKRGCKLNVNLVA